MALFAMLFLVSYIIALILLVVLYLTKKKRISIPHIEEALMAFIIYSIMFLFLALATSDPIPHWDYLLLVVALTSPLWYEAVKKDIAEEVVEELSAEEIEYREISLAEAKKEILTYGKMREEFRIEDIVTDLRIDPILVIKAIRELEKENQIEEVKRGANNEKLD